jgi:DNA-directed RNA polymerase specialized sigma24 family protein
MVPFDEAYLSGLEARVSEYGFDESYWPDLVDALAAYGLRVIGSWVATGEIFTVLGRRRIRYEMPAAGRQRPGRDDAAEIAGETVARGLVKLREILEEKRWDANGGARLRTFFVTQCLFQFPNVYRRWRHETAPFELFDGVELDDLVDDSDEGDPAALVVAQRQAVDRLRSVPNDFLRAVLHLYADGFRVSEIAATLGVLPKQVENALGRYRRRCRQRNEDKDRVKG